MICDEIKLKSNIGNHLFEDIKYVYSLFRNWKIDEGFSGRIQMLWSKHVLDVQMEMNKRKIATYWDWEGTRRSQPNVYFSFHFVSFVFFSLRMKYIEYENKWKPRSHLCTYEPVFIMHMRNSYLNARKQPNSDDASSMDAGGGGQKERRLVAITTQMNRMLQKIECCGYRLRNGNCSLADSVWCWWYGILIRGSDFRTVDVSLFRSSLLLLFHTPKAFASGICVSVHRVCASWPDIAEMWKPTIFISANTTHLLENVNAVCRKW